jgi:hypothetical protein
MSEDTKPDIGKAVLVPAAAGCGLGCLTAIGFGILALHLGFCVVFPSLALFGGMINFLLVLTTAIVLRFRKRQPSWKFFLVEIGVIAFLWVSFSVWTTPRDLFKRCFLKQPIPSCVVIHRAHHFQGGPDAEFWIHFSANPSVMSVIIQSNKLKLAPADSDGIADRRIGALGVDHPSWWKPDALSHPSLYYCWHDGTDGTYNPWSMGIWINDKTNEAFGYIR